MLAMLPAVSVASIVTSGTPMVEACAEMVSRDASDPVIVTTPLLKSYGVFSVVIRVVGAAMTGGVVSIVTGSAADIAPVLWLPAISNMRAAMVCTPTPSGVVIFHGCAPLAPNTALSAPLIAVPPL